MTEEDERVAGEASPLVGSPVGSWADDGHEHEHGHEREHELETKSTWYLILLTLSIGG